MHQISEVRITPGDGAWPKKQNLIFQHFIVYLQNNTDSLRFTHGSFARMAELVDALDSKSNVLKKTCRFEPGFGHKKMRVSTLIFLCPDGTLVFIGECLPQPPSVASLLRHLASLHPHFFVP